MRLFKHCAIAILGFGLLATSCKKDEPKKSVNNEEEVGDISQLQLKGAGDISFELYTPLKEEIVVKDFSYRGGVLLSPYTFIKATPNTIIPNEKKTVFTQGEMLGDVRLPLREKVIIPKPTQYLDRIVSNASFSFLEKGSPIMSDKVILKLFLNNRLMAIVSKVITLEDITKDDNKPISVSSSFDDVMTITLNHVLYSKESAPETEKEAYVKTIEQKIIEKYSSKE